MTDGKNRKLIWKLAKNDFKKRYAGSYMGALWALVQPVVTVVLYYFVFEVVFQNRSQMLANGIEAPYVLWLTAGLVPWFYFSEAVMQGMYAFLEYNYLVKKVVFEIRVLPVVKVLGASFIHVFFAAVLLLMYFIYGMKPSLCLLQLPYYSFCMFLLILAISYTTSAIVVFFRDLAQIVNILMQIGMWATPILWDLSFLRGRWEALRIFFQLNPVYYIVNGYRESLFEGRWFWQDLSLTLYFWGVTLILYGIGMTLFKRCKVHFADVL
ncbi:MAG: ABC transporter permease [Lachnospiraceae bacterium]|nr:ABC transporter permease [Lachnospiraceae bacterium]